MRSRTSRAGATAAPVDDAAAVNTAPWSREAAKRHLPRNPLRDMVGKKSCEGRKLCV